MNKKWIEHSQIVAGRAQSSNRLLERFEYLDAVGLYETGWLLFNHTDDIYAYPQPKRT